MPASVVVEGSKTKWKKKSSGKKDASNGKGSLVLIGKKRKRGKIVYPEFDVTLFKKGTKEGVLTASVARKLLGWTDDVPDNVEALLEDLEGNKIICMHNTDNRPFVKALTHDWMLEILRGKWRLNGETIIIDRTGMVQDGQHRLIGLVLAAQEHEKHSERWTEYWKSEPYVEALVVTGVLEDDDTINSIGVSKPRNRTDVVFRSDLLSDIVARKDRKTVSNILSYAVKILWERTAANIGPYRLVPKRSHSGFLDFIARHPRIEECARFIWKLDQPERKLVRFVPMGTAAGMLYLMGASKSDQDSYIATNSEEAVDWSTWDKSVAFWEALANGSKRMRILAEKLAAVDSTGVLGYGEKVGMLVKAWDMFLNDTPITAEDISILTTTDDYDMPVLAEKPVIGGIDVGSHEDDDDAE